MTVVVTGGTGLLGRSVLELLAGVEEVVALIRPGGSPPEIQGIRWVEQDLAAPLRDDLPTRIDAVLHLAQSRRQHELPEGAPDVFAVNAMATVRLLDLCVRSGGSRFVLASSGAVYPAGPAPLSESDAPAPPSFYGEAKLAAERATRSFGDWLAPEILRFFFIYGPRQHASAFIPGLAERIRSGAPIDLRGPDGMRCNPIHVDDAAAAVVAARERSDGATVNVAGPEVVSLRWIGERIGALLGLEASFTEVAGGGDLVADIGLMRERLGDPRIGPEQGLARMFAG
jgi:nucleoside-diphosphate-sugar epimerase